MENDDLELSKRINAIRKERDKQRLHEALLLAADIKNWLQKNDPKNYAAWSRIEYEEGFILCIRGEYEDAVEAFKNSQNHAQKGGDELRAIIGNFRKTLTLYLSGSSSADSAYRDFLQLYRNCKSLNAPPEDKGLQIHSGFNLIKRLSDVTFELGLAEFTDWHDLLMNHQFLENISQNVPYTILKTQLIARNHIFHQRYLEAIIEFSSFLDVDLKKEFPNVDGQRDEKLFQYAAHQEPEEIARDYRDLAQTILQSNSPLKKEIAIAVLDRGLMIKSGRGNKRFLTDLQNELNSLKK